jgi:thioesterase-3
VQSILEIIVRSTEIDLNGHVNNAKYLEYLEWGREEWYEKAGLYYSVLSDLGVFTVVVNINVNYKKECRQGDRVMIFCRPISIKRSSYVLEQRIWNERNELCIEATVTCVTLNTTTRKSCEAPEELRKLFPI